MTWSKTGAALCVVGMALASPASGQMAGTTADLYGQLESEREQGVICAALLKGYGSPREQLTGRMDYTAARAAFNATIDTLSYALVTDETPTGLEAVFEEGVQHRTALCDHTLALLPDMEGTRNPLVALLATGVLGDLSKLLDSVREIRGEIVETDTVRRNAMLSMLDAKKWPPFDDISPQQ
jgi:hypothetical protein